MTSLVNDLLQIISTYATEPVTFALLSIDAFLVDKLYATEVWYHKVLYENRGLHVSDDIIGGKWFNNYRLVNRTYYGTANIITAPHRVKDIIPLKRQAIHGLQYRSTNNDRSTNNNQALIQTIDGNVSIFSENVDGDPILTRTYKHIPPIRTITPDVFANQDKIHWSDERGQAYSYNHKQPKLELTYSNANDPVVMVQG